MCNKKNIAIIQKENINNMLLGGKKCIKKIIVKILKENINKNMLFGGRKCNN